MEFNGLHTLSLPFAVQDALIAVGAGVALLACLAFINLGILLPGLLTSLGGPQPDQRGAYLEFGPTAAPIISGPAPSRVTQEQTQPRPRPAARPHIWRHLLGGTALPMSPQHAIER
jgi:hypothetical protein